MVQPIEVAMIAGRIEEGSAEMLVFQPRLRSFAPHPIGEYKLPFQQRPRSQPRTGCGDRASGGAVGQRRIPEGGGGSTRPRARQRLHVRKRAKSCDGAIVRFSRTDNTVLKLTPVLKKHKYTVWRSSPYMYNSRAADHT